MYFEKSRRLLSINIWKRRKYNNNNIDFVAEGNNTNKA
jgi:hypothetical protein